MTLREGLQRRRTVRQGEGRDHRPCGREGTDVEKKLPALSTYLGHTCVRDTYWYLSTCPELMQEAAQRLDRRWETKP